MTRRLVLVLGGTRSGKSRHGLERARTLSDGGPVTYLATARPGDPELDRRIDGHRRVRPADWPTIEVSDDLAATILSVPPATTILLDGLTLWLSAAYTPARHEIDAFIDGPLTDALEAIARREGPVVVVSDEVGLGIVPMDAWAREFRDLIGIAHQRIATAADEVTLMVAGIAMSLRST